MSIDSEKPALLRNSTTDHAVYLLTHYGFDLQGHRADRLVSQWSTLYQVHWIRPAVIEALYQGRYKAVSVAQILALWHRRGQPLCHFSHEFERIICHNPAQSASNQATLNPESSDLAGSAIAPTPSQEFLNFPASSAELLPESLPHEPDPPEPLDPHRVDQLERLRALVEQVRSHQIKWRDRATLSAETHPTAPTDSQPSPTQSSAPETTARVDPLPLAVSSPPHPREVAPEPEVSTAQASTQPELTEPTTTPERTHRDDTSEQPSLPDQPVPAEPETDITADSDVTQFPPVTVPATSASFHPRLQSHDLAPSALNSSESLGEPHAEASTPSESRQPYEDALLRFTEPDAEVMGQQAIHQFVPATESDQFYAKLQRLSLKSCPIAGLDRS